jgi:hypothetical protein
LAYDSKRGRTVLFGGFPQLADLGGDASTWEWDGEFWTEINDIGPTPRGYHRMAFDSERQVTVCFGGKDGNGVNLRDTWEWDGENWTQVADGGPVPRRGPAMVFDSDRKRVVVFGGVDQEFHTLSDTWEWDGAVWTQVDDTGPSARGQTPAAYNPARQAITLFSGVKNPRNGPELSPADTWERSNGAWKQVSEIGPAAMENHAMAVNGGGVILFAPDGSTWGWNGSHWTRRQDIGPGSRADTTLAYDSVRDRTILFGGLAAGVPQPLGDTWELSAQPANG